MNQKTIGGLCLVAILTFCAIQSTIADEPPKEKPPATPTTKETPKQSAEAAKEKPTGNMNAKEQAFAKLLTGAAMEGTWRMTHFDKPNEEMKLGEPKADLYEIVSAVKSGGESWVITARIVYADRDVKLPVPVRVVWADDTPMITLTELTMPILGTYSARVIFHHGFYSGIWYGAGYGGVMSGQVTKSSKDPSGEN
ncbi:MAG: hypothetical protein DHS20C16_02670 [Phycisphaerae bacterium]|nr:MAG: hypothetical protein DHS20C16_02670 [Phycisphaerae bacterium]